MEKKLTVKEVSSILQVEESIIRFWEKEFSEYLNIRVPKGESYRYSQHHLEIFTQIKELMQTELYTIKGAKRRLDLDRTLTSALGVEHNFKTTVFFMFSSIMQELQQAREESKKLVEQLELLRKEKSLVDAKLMEEQNKGLFEFLRDRIQAKWVNEG